MTKREFAEEVATKANGKVNEVEKANGIRLTGICVGEGDICPTIYIDAMYDEGMSVDEAVVEVNKIASEQTIPEIDIKGVTKYESVKDKIVLRLYNEKTNAEVFRSAEEYGYYDLIFVPYIALTEEMFIKITNGLLDMWGKTSDEVIDTAMENTKCDDFYCQPLFKIFFGMDDNVEDCFECEDPNMPLFCISNKRKFYGASGIYLHGTLQEEVGFDLVGCKRKPKKEGIYDVEVALPDGNVRNAILYYWQDANNKDRGLIVDKFDIEEMHIYALRMYRRKTEVI